MSQVDVKYFNQAHELVSSVTAMGAHYAIKTETKSASYPDGGAAMRREHSAWLLSEPTTMKKSASKQILVAWIDQVSR